MARILIADDSNTQVQYLRQILTPLGHEILVASDGEDAEAKCLEQRPDLVILDIVMPKRNGFQVTRAIRQHPGMQSLPILVVTSMSRDSDRYWGLKQGANAYLNKPFDPQVLVSTVQKLLAG
ncbi:MAG TPA: response regulator [Myxococcota bacterium]|nr:response regulator [Myxococcota bacterium]